MKNRTNQVRTYADEVWVNGEKIYFRKKILKGWKGHVVVQYGQFVLVRQGGSYFWMHPSNLQGEKLTPRENRKTETLQNRKDLTYTDTGEYQYWSIKKWRVKKVILKKVKLKELVMMKVRLKQWLQRWRW